MDCMAGVGGLELEHCVQVANLIGSSPGCSSAVHPDARNIGTLFGKLTETHLVDLDVNEGGTWVAINGLLWLATTGFFPYPHT